MSVRHFLTLLDLSPSELNQVLDRADALKAMQQQRISHALFPQFSMAMVFEKSSTRTRISFETAMAQLGGHALFLSSRDTQLGRGEPISDSARVMSSMNDIIMIRTFGHDKIEEFAKYSSAPVINALTDDYHPCQLLADMQTYREHRGSIQGKTVTWIGDGNNMCQSYINAARQFDFELKIACPKGFEPKQELLDANKNRIFVTTSVDEAAKNADLLVTDVWASMGQEDTAGEKGNALEGYQINRDLLSKANTDAVYMHCLPAHRGEEITDDLMEDPSSIIWDEAENRLHAQKALIEFLLNACR